MRAKSPPARLLAAAATSAAVIIGTAVITGASPAQAATADWTFPSNAATLPDVAKSIRADVAYGCGSR